MAAPVTDGNAVRVTSSSGVTQRPCSATTSGRAAPGVTEHERQVLLDGVLEPGLHRLEERQVSLHSEVEHGFEVIAVPEGDAEVAGIQLQLAIAVTVGSAATVTGMGVGREVAHELVAEEVDRDAVVVAPGQVAPEL